MGEKEPAALATKASGGNAHSGEQQRGGDPVPDIDVAAAGIAVTDEGVGAAKPAHGGKH